MEIDGMIQVHWVVAVGLLTWAVMRLHKLGHRPSDLPPGPPTIPILGNLPILPKQSAYLQMTTWAREYGEIFSLVGGPSGNIIVLTSPRAIHDVLEKQGSITADRPQTVVTGLIFNGRSLGTSNYNGFWKATRRAAMEILKPHACAKHLPLQIAESNQLMYDILHVPEEIYTHVQRLSISTMLSVMFGQRTPRFATPFINDFFDLARRNIAVSSLDGTQLLQIFPILQYVPERFAAWKTACKAVRQETKDMIFGLTRQVEERSNKGQSNGCYMEGLLERADDLKLTREDICYFGWSLTGGGTGTSSTWLHFFFLCMAAHPHVQSKAQDEIDKVVGRDRAPQIADLDSLPYVQAIISEVSRFRPVVPMGLAHVSSADVLYRGYRIPAGSLIYCNTWGVSRDERLFANPDSFDPERFMSSPLGLKSGVEIDDEDAFKRLNTLPWGCGRRICPGINLAQQALAINVLNLLWGFTFNKARDPVDGSEIEVDLWAFSPMAVIHVHPFNLNPTVRSADHAAIIESNYFASTSVFERFEQELGTEDREYLRGVRARPQ